MFVTSFCFLVISANTDDACIITHILLENQYHLLYWTSGSNLMCLVVTTTAETPFLLLC
jgi:hypothetical protein